MYNRIFAFGCSYTHFLWPTWANIIEDDLNISAQNWGLSGIGNVGIFHKILECDLKNKFTDKDLILVNWSSWSREDRVNSLGDWQAGGNVFNNHFYDKRFIKQHWTETNDIVKNSTAIISANKMFNINYQSHMIDYEGDTEYGETRYNFSNYKFYLDSMPKKNIFDTSCNTRFNNLINDLHPDVLCHLDHVKTIYKDLNLTLKTSTAEKYTRLQNDIIEKINSSNIDPNKNWDNLFNFFKGLNL